MADSNGGDPTECPFLDWDLYSLQPWELVDDGGKTQVRYATRLFSEAFLVPGVISVRKFR